MIRDVESKQGSKRVLSAIKFYCKQKIGQNGQLYAKLASLLQVDQHQNLMLCTLQLQPLHCWVIRAALATSRKHHRIGAVRKLNSQTRCKVMKFLGQILKLTTTAGCSLTDSCRACRNTSAEGGRTRALPAVVAQVIQNCLSVVSSFGMTLINQNKRSILPRNKYELIWVTTGCV